MADARSPSGENRGKKSLGLSLHNIYETLAISVPTLIDAMGGRVTKQKSDDRLQGWAANIIRNARITIDVVGREHLTQPPPGLGSSFLVMSNHQSLYDVPVLFVVLGANLRMITKKELFAVPIFGKALDHGGFISIDRNNRDAALGSLAIAKRMLADGTNVWIAPEGTRSRTGELLPFKKGGFNLALQADLPILPVTLRGTRDVLVADGLLSHEGAHVTATIHRAIDPRAYHTDKKKDGRDRLMSDVRAVLESAL
jgi:1-acyl-sn-glycerol-3-phosphate acyltransferase